MRSRLRVIAQETVAIVERGWYHGPQGGEVRVDIGHAVAGTRLYLPGHDLPESGEGGPGVRIEVTGESTLAAARRLGGDVAALNFASARSPGGGFLNGAQAQEESLARSSGLYPCLRAADDFYVHHRAQTELTYTDRVIYSPRVPVFRDDEGALLTEAYPVTFLTSAAPNLREIRRSQPHLAAEVPAILRRRAARVLAVAAAHGHRRLVLGAWGCGVFANDPATVAEAFAAALARQPMDEVVFAILGPNRAEFAAVLAGRQPGG
ncbi:TIGR02452 family protein [Actinoplanes sp. NPDC049118]|uniref:TIGR02452 family protein n=1 Tax=Actinoplanes sp. NPDC049118 TaxID=3155769 RepID=UPI0033D7E528